MFEYAKAGKPARRQDVEVLAVSHDPALLSTIAVLLGPHCGRIRSAESYEDALNLIDECDPYLVVADVSAPDCDVAKLLEAVNETSPFAQALTIADAGDMDKAVEAARLGAFDSLSKPLDAERFLGVAKRAIDSIIEFMGRGMAAGKFARGSNGKTMVGQSEAMRQVFETIEKVKDVTSNVLVYGETGTGKELVACAIHDSSPRSKGPLVKLNCGAIPKDLLESELFGHEKGSFTGALQQRIGRFETAHRGTILLDEIGDMPLDLQVKLLGVIQDRVVQRVGGHERIPVDVRIIAATHQNLQRAIRHKEFREDLYYRLNVITIKVPPLRQHKEDVSLLVEHFVGIYSRETGRRIESVEPDAMRMLLNYDYPGNVRELENIIESSVVMCSDKVIRVRDLPRDLGERWGGMGNEIVIHPGTPLSEVERLCIVETLRYTDGDKQRAAEMLGINLRTIYRKLEQYGIPADLARKQAV